MRSHITGNLVPGYHVWRPSLARRSAPGADMSPVIGEGLQSASSRRKCVAHQGLPLARCGLRWFYRNARSIDRSSVRDILAAMDHPCRQPSLVFWDRTKHLQWLFACDVAMSLLSDARHIETLKAAIERWRHDLGMRRAFIAWSALLEQPVTVITERLQAMDDAAEFLRDTMPAGAPLQQSRDTIRAIRAQQHREGHVRYRSSY